MVNNKTRGICTIDGCDKLQRARGYCHPHLSRWYRYGDPLAGRIDCGAAMVFLETTVIPFEGDECLIWPYGRDGGGYGKVVHNGRPRNAHRVACEIVHGLPPTPKHEAAHSCGKGHEGCVNPRHLEWKTRKENHADKLAHGTHSRGERHGAAKLTAAQVLEIRASTRPLRELAEKYGITQSAVSSIKLRKNWAWLEDAA